VAEPPAQLLPFHYLNIQNHKGVCHVSITTSTCWLAMAERCYTTFQLPLPRVG